MINPDGVISGNYRTSFIGKDLNRLYMQKDSNDDTNPAVVNKMLIPEIVAIKQLIQTHKKQILCFIDVHHHCVKRGSFMYGPCAPLNTEAIKYYEVRVLPKLLGLSTEMFRYHSCRFKPEEHYKENCARFWTQELGVQYSYCFECSQ